jgi:fluoride exporter
MRKVLFLALAGGCGTLARYWLSGLVYDVMGREFPWGTAAVNLFGCLLFGIVFVLADERLIIRADVRLVVLMGFMGAFTTFSTLIFETNQLLHGAQWLYAGANIFGQNILGFTAFATGVVIGRMV